MLTKHTLRRDMQVPLDQIQRGWIRKSLTILLTVIFIWVGIVFGAVEGVAYFWREFTVKCWKGE